MLRPKTPKEFVASLNSIASSIEANTATFSDGIRPLESSIHTGWILYALESLRVPKALDVVLGVRMLQAQNQAKWLHKNACTALSDENLLPKEGALWVQKTAKLVDLLCEAAGAVDLWIREARSRKHRVKKKRKDAVKAESLRNLLVEANDWRTQLKSMAKDKEDGEKQASDVDLEKMEQKRAQDRSLWFSGNKAAEKLARKSKNGRMLTPDEVYGVTTYPVVLANYRFGRNAVKLLASVGITTSKLYARYLHIHNCRLIGFKHRTLPSDTNTALNIVRESIERMRDDTDSMHMVRGFSLLNTHPTKNATHTYFMLMPDDAIREIGVTKWDLALPMKHKTTPVEITV